MFIGMAYKTANQEIPLVAKGDKFSLDQCPKIEFDKRNMENIIYDSTGGSLM